MNQSKVIRLFDEYSVKFKSGHFMNKTGFALAVEEMERDSESSTLARVQREYKEVENILSGGFKETRFRIAATGLVKSAQKILYMGLKVDKQFDKQQLGEVLIDIILIANALGISAEDALIEVWHMRKQTLNDSFEKSDKEAGSV